jgi:hypothetical protein
VSNRIIWIIAVVILALIAGAVLARALIGNDEFADQPDALGVETEK